MEKADLIKGYQNPKRKWGITTHFSEIIELKFGKKLPYILCILTLFWNYGSLIISEKCLVTPNFSFWIPITLAEIYFSPIVITFAKIHLYYSLITSLSSELTGNRKIPKPSSAVVELNLHKKDTMLSITMGIYLTLTPKVPR